MAWLLQLKSQTARNESRHTEEKNIPPKMLGFFCDLWEVGFIEVESLGGRAGDGGLGIGLGFLYPAVLLYGGCACTWGH